MIDYSVITLGEAIWFSYFLDAIYPCNGDELAVEPSMENVQ